MLDSLIAALEASPDNTELKKLVLQECLKQAEYEKALALVERFNISGEQWPQEDQRLLAELFYSAGRYKDALDMLSEDTAAPLLLKAKVLLRLERREEAKRAYDKAVQLNPALEDAAFNARLTQRVVSITQAKSAREKTQANDDTDDAEVIRLLHSQSERVTFKDIGGLTDIKKQIQRKIILPFQKPSLFQRFKKKAGGGILMYGPPGCGKTLLARATAGECGATFYNVAISDILDMYIGESERKLHAIFEQARRSAPAVLFFDEVEALGGKRQFTREATSSKLVSQFLSELDGFAQNNQGVLILAATNVPWAVDAAFRRPGRFDRVLFVPPPDRQARDSILEQLLIGRPTKGAIDTASLAKLTSGFSGADLRNLVETAVDEAIEESIDAGEEVPLSQVHLKAVLQQIKSTTAEWLTTARNYARYSNESGQYDEVLEFLKQHGKG